MLSAIAPINKKEKIEKMQITKKIYTTLIITLLTISMILAAMPMASAVTNPPGLWVPASTPTTPKTSGTVGSKVMVVGNSTHGTASPFSTVTIYWHDLSGQVLGTVSAGIGGLWAINVTIPSAITGLNYIVAKDDGAAQGAQFTVTQSLSAGKPPVRALPGDSVTLTGHGYAASSAITVTLNSTTLTPQENITITTPTITTNATGSFSAVIVIPGTITPTQYDTYDVTATDAATSAATTQVTIDYYVTVTPTSGPPGITITMAGRIPASTAYSLLIDTTTIRTGTSGTDGKFSQTYTIPALIASGAHTIYVRWIIATVVYNRTASFSVTAAPTLVLGATSGVAGVVVTISGAGFSSFSNITLYLGTTVVNSTATDSRFGPTSGTGTFSEEFTVPALAPGVYTLTVTDQYGATTGTVYTFTVSPTPATTVALRGTSYYQGDTISFNIFTTESNLGTITVTVSDPAGATWWTTAAWTLTGTTIKRVLYQNQTIYGNPLALPADAPLGSWNWTVTYAPASTGTTTKATALFTVAALPTMQTVLDQLDTMEASIKSVVTTSEGDIIAVVNTKSGEIIADLSALDAKITSIDGSLVTISTSIGDIETIISNLDMGTLGVDITAIKGDVATIKTNIGTVTTSVASLDAKVTTLSGDVATVSTTLGTLQGTVTSIDGKVATIETDVGTVQADISDVSGKVDTTPAWIAVVLSLIAAIAAIFAVITIRQKIAG